MLGSDSGLLGIDRDAEHENTSRAAEAGVGADVVEYRPELRMLVISYLPGRTLSDADLRDPGCSDGRPPPAAGSTRDRRSRATSTCSPAGPPTAATVAERGFALPSTYDEHADAWDDVRRALTAGRPASKPCNNDLLAANFIDDGDRIWLIDYEYSGNNDPVLRARQHGHGVRLHRGADRRVAGGIPGGTAERADLARVRLQALCSEYGWSLWGFIQAATSPLDFDFATWGQVRFDKAEPHVPKRAVPTAAGGRASA